jgi:5-methylcytosine-specific restriction endonuclease McrA
MTTFDTGQKTHSGVLPSLRHRVETTMSWTNRIARWAPVRAVHLEQVAFDTHAIAAGRTLEGAEYQHGTLHGTEVREYLLAKWGRACAYCGASGVPLNIDHIHPQSRGGSDRITNLAIACIPCNQTKNNTPIEDFLKHKPKQLAKILTQAKAPLRDAAGGFPRKTNPRTKTVHGFQTGDYARAVVPTGKHAGTHTGRTAVRSTGKFNIQTRHGLVQGIHHRHIRLLQRADGYSYATQEEGTS